MSHRSVSQLKTYTACSEAYRLKYIEGEPWVPAAWTAVGTAFHEAYEHWEDSRRGVPLDNLFTQHYDRIIHEFKEIMPNLDGWMRAPNVKDTNRDIDLRREAGIEQCRGFEKHARQAEWLPASFSGQRAIEVRFEIDLGGVRIVGAADLVKQWPTGALTICDFKTGNRELSARQLGIYRLALNRSFGVEIKYGEYWYLKDGKNVGYDLSRYTEEYLTDQFVKLDKAIDQQLFFPSPSSSCKMCDVSNHCREMSE